MSIGGESTLASFPQEVGMYRHKVSLNLCSAHFFILQLDCTKPKQDPHIPLTAV